LTQTIQRIFTRNKKNDLDKVKQTNKIANHNQIMSKNYIDWTITS